MDNSTYNCEICDYKIKKRYDLEQHILTEHEGLRYECNKCEESFKRIPLLTGHKKSVHNIRTEYKCSRCDYKNNKISNVKSHEDGVHDNIKRSNPSSKFPSLTNNSSSSSKYISSDLLSCLLEFNKE